MERGLTNQLVVAEVERLQVEQIAEPQRNLPYTQRITEEHVAVVSE